LDIDFIHKVDNEFRKCNIDTWLDEIDIKHGSNWMAEIFENGIAKCDLVFVYITKNSLSSPMVSKEIDSTIINQFNEKRVKLLLYVDSIESRNKLRLDLQTIHSPELNLKNFYKIFPAVVANIWSNYLNNITAKILREKDIEIENYKLKEEKRLSQKMFMEEYEQEFVFLYNELNKYFEIECELNVIGSKKACKYKLNIINTLYLVYNQQFGNVNQSTIVNSISDYLEQKLNISISSAKIIGDTNLMNTFVIFGFLSRNFNPKQQTSDTKMMTLSMFHSYEIFLKSEKFDKFMLWIKYKNIEYDKTISEVKNV
jgi:hypothetical protein